MLLRAILGKALLWVSISCLTCWAGPVTVGSIVYLNPLVSGFQGFEIINETGPTDGCDASSSIPVCTVLAFQGTSLTVTLSDNSTLTRTPSGGFSFGPGAYIYGDNGGDDPAQSFLFDPALTIVSAVFTGTVFPASFQITDGTSQSTFFSAGVFSTMLDLSGGQPAAANDITVDEQATAVPEPGSAMILFSCMSALAGILRFKK